MSAYSVEPVDSASTSPSVRGTDVATQVTTSALAKRFPTRFLLYLIERFSLFSVVPASLLHYLFIANYATGGIDIAALATPSFASARWIAGFATFLGLFLCLRLADDMKDKHHDDTYYSERPVQRGLVTLRELAFSLAVLVVLLVALNVLVANAVVLALFIATLSLMTLMRFEFFVPGFLRPRLLLYLATHQMFVPVLTAYVIYFEGGKVAGPGAVLFLVLNLLMIMAVEVARKTRPAALDQTGRDTYSAYLGRGGAVVFLLAILLAAQSLFNLVAHVPLWLAVSLALPAMACIYYFRVDSKSSSRAVLNSTVLFLTINMLAAMVLPQ
ncbi:MAG TPA: hypothetical protein VLQ48_12270 [Chloroflexia bacterium]|nr:hypothetical protein [Chloroflexia bacterium]